MKLLFFASDFQIGLSALLVDEAIALHHQGIPLLCLSGEHEQEQGLRASLQKEGIPFMVMQGLDVHHNFKQLAYQVKCVIEQHEITHIHVQNNWQLAIMAYIKYVLRFHGKVEIFYTLHGFRHNSFVKSIIARLLIGSLLLVAADRIICMCRYLQSVFFPLKYKSVLLPLGVHDAFFAHREQPSIRDAGLQVIYAAQFRKGKNQALVIKAFADYLKRTGDSNSHLFLPGSGMLLSQAKHLVSSLGLQERVSFPGQCSKSKVLDIYKKCNVAVVASNNETFGQSIVEPWILGLVVASRPVGVASNIIIHDKTGFLFKKQAELADILSQLAACPGIQEEIKAAISRNRKMFSWKSVASEYQRILLKKAK